MKLPAKFCTALFPIPLLFSVQGLTISSPYATCLHRDSNNQVTVGNVFSFIILPGSDWNMERGVSDLAGVVSNTG